MFCKSVKALHPSFFSNRLVLDIGSLDINGNNHDYDIDDNNHDYDNKRQMTCQAQVMKSAIGARWPRAMKTSPPVILYMYYYYDVMILL